MADNTLYNDGYYWQKECVHCGKQYGSKREDSLTCSPRCRKAKQRSDERQTEQMYATQRAVEKLIERQLVGDGDEYSMLVLKLLYSRLRGYLGAYGHLGELGEVDFHLEHD